MLTPLRALVPCALLASCHAAPSTLARPLDDSELNAVLQATRQRVKTGGPNDTHMLRLFVAAPRFANAAGAELAVVQTAALMHDATKEDGAGGGRCVGAEGAARARAK